jgi:hypothetical protein
VATRSSLAATEAKKQKFQMFLVSLNFTPLTA